MMARMAARAAAWARRAASKPAAMLALSRLVLASRVSRTVLYWIRIFSRVSVRSSPSLRSIMRRVASAAVW